MRLVPDLNIPFLFTFLRYLIVDCAPNMETLRLLHHSQNIVTATCYSTSILGATPSVENLKLPIPIPYSSIMLLTHYSDV